MLSQAFDDMLIYFDNLFLSSLHISLKIHNIRIHFQINFSLILLLNEPVFLERQKHRHEMFVQLAVDCLQNDFYVDLDVFVF